MTWRYLTPERTQMHLWTRKRRLKFKKLWRKKHGGVSFRWIASEFRSFVTAPEEKEDVVILYVRDTPSP